MVIFNFQLFLFFLTVFVVRPCFNEFLSLLDVAWVNKVLYYVKGIVHRLKVTKAPKNHG